MNLKQILSTLPSLNEKRNKTFLKGEKVQENENKPPFKGIKRVSDKRAKEERQYSKDRKQHLEESDRCELKILGVCTHKATTIHHSKGRIGKLLLDKKWWKRGCMPCHDFVERHPEKARELGLSFLRFNK